MTSRVPVCAMPLLDPALGRIEMDVPAGWSVAQIVDAALRNPSEAVLDRARVWLVSNVGETLLSVRDHWRRVRPLPGVRVMIKVIPGDTDMLKSTLMIAVSIGATALGQFWAGPAILEATGSALLANIGGAVFGIGVTLAGGALINWLIPDAPGEREKPLYTFSGWQNRANPDGPVPSIFGKHRVSPPFAAPNYSEIVGDDHYIHALFIVGYGQYELSDLRIKDTPVTNYREFEYDIIDGNAANASPLYPQQVIEESVGAEVARPRERDENGEIVGVGPTVPIVRLTAGDASEANVILNFPTGLGKAGDGGDIENHSVNIRIRQRPAAGGSFSEVTTLTITAAQREPFFRQYRWTLPERGRWEIEVTRLTSEPTNPRINERSTWVSLQSFRPEYPINFSKPITAIAVRIRATHQLNGNLDAFNLIAERLIPDYDQTSGTWITRKTRNPVSAFRQVLQGDEAAYPEADSGLDLALLQDWHDFCRIKGLKYDRIHDFEASLWDVLSDVARAGRASPRHDGRKWGVVIDRPSGMVIAHVNPRNSRDFKWSRNYVEPPHAFRVSFIDQSSDYQPREMLVRWPGYAGPITVTEALQLPGKTDPSEIWRETRRRQYEVIHRPDRFEAIQDIAVTAATRGDLVKLSYDTLDRTLVAHRVSVVRGQLLTLDGYVTMEEGKSYALRFLRQSGESFTSTVRQVVFSAGETDTILLDGNGFVPDAGTLIHFGEAGKESMDVVVAGTESGEGMTTVLTMLAAAPIIDTLTDAEIAPAWDGRVGTEAGPDVTVPLVPKVVSATTSFDEEGEANGLTVLLGPATSETALLASYSLRHRLDGASSWSAPIVVAAASGAIFVPGYTQGQKVEMQRMATSRAGYSSAWSSTFSRTLAAPTPAPAAVPSASVVAGLGSAQISFATPSGPNLARVHVYRGPTSDIADAALVASIPVLKSSSYVHVDGDATRPNIIVNGGFASDTDWDKAASWLITGGKAVKSGDAGVISQAATLMTGDVIRYAFTIEDRTDGALALRLVGGTTVTGTSFTSDGRKLGAVTVNGNTAIGLYGTAAFEGKADNLVAYVQSSASIPQGEQFYFLCAANSAGRESAPFSLPPVTII